MPGKPKTFSEALAEIERLATDAQPDLRKKIEDELGDLKAKFKPRVEEFTHGFEDEIKKGKRRVEQEVAERPWLTLGVVGVIFFVLGYLFSTRRRD